MDQQFWKVLGTLFGIGVAISFAKSLKSKLSWREILSESIISGFACTVAGSLLIWYPTAPLVAVMGVGALIGILGVAFLSNKLEAALQMLADKYLSKKES